jgi:hypothetical protein
MSRGYDPSRDCVGLSVGKKLPYRGNVIVSL